MNWEILNQTPLFCCVPEEDLPSLLKRLGARCKTYAAREIILWEGEPFDRVGIVLTGTGRSIKQEASGKTIVLTLLEPGSAIGILLAASPGRKSPVTVQAVEEMTVLFLPIASVLREAVLAQQYMRCVAEKALLLHDRIDCLLRGTVREKILACLEKAAAEQGSAAVILPMNRGAMAEYLNVERSALSRELSRMRRDGLLTFHKNTFHLL